MPLIYHTLPYHAPHGTSLGFFLAVVVLVVELFPVLVFRTALAPPEVVLALVSLPQLPQSSNDELEDCAGGVAALAREEPVREA